MIIVNLMALQTHLFCRFAGKICCSWFCFQNSVNGIIQQNISVAISKTNKQHFSPLDPEHRSHKRNGGPNLLKRETQTKEQLIPIMAIMASWIQITAIMAVALLPCCTPTLWGDCLFCIIHGYHYDVYHHYYQLWKQQTLWRQMAIRCWLIDLIVVGWWWN